MSAGMVIEVQGGMWERGAAAGVRVLDGADLQARYDQLLALVLRMGSWLSGPHARLLPAAEWDTLFAAYRENLEQVRRLGDQLRPVSLRNRYEPLAGDALVAEVVELFAA